MTTKEQIAKVLESSAPVYVLEQKSTFLLHSGGSWDLMGSIKTMKTKESIDIEAALALLAEAKQRMHRASGWANYPEIRREQEAAEKELKLALMLVDDIRERF